MNDFKFNPDTHTYTLDGKRMTGVTTVLGVINKPALIGWSARMASEYVLENLKDLNDLEEVCEAAKTAHARKRDKAAESGTDVHGIIESWIKAAIKETGGLIIGEARNPDVYDNKQVKNFLVWAENNKVKFLVSEKVMYHPNWFVGGTADFTCEIDGKKYVGDIKTSSGIYDRTPFFQCAGYRGMLESMGEKDYHGSVIVHLPKSGVFTEEKNILYSYDYDTDLEGFLSALRLYHILKTK